MENPKKRNIISKITYLGVGIKPKNGVEIEGAAPTYLVLKTKDEMISLQRISFNTIVFVEDINQTFIFSNSRKLWMLIRTNC